MRGVKRHGEAGECVAGLLLLPVHLQCDDDDDDDDGDGGGVASSAVAPAGSVAYRQLSSLIIRRLQRAPDRLHTLASTAAAAAGTGLNRRVTAYVGCVAQW